MNKRHIDNLTYGQLLSRWRFAPIGDPWFQGETGEEPENICRGGRAEGSAASRLWGTGFRRPT